MEFLLVSSPKEMVRKEISFPLKQFWVFFFLFEVLIYCINLGVELDDL